MNFDQWLRQVDSILVAGLGLGHRELRDRNWRDAFDDGYSPEEAVDELVGGLDDDNIDATMMEELFG